MTPPLPISPFDPSRYVGSVFQVGPDIASLNLPSAAAIAPSQYAGYSVPKGEVGEFIFIQGEFHALLGRITEVRLPERDRQNIERREDGVKEVNPIGTVQLLTSLHLASGKVISGIPEHPRIGHRAYSAHPLLVKHIVESTTLQASQKIDLAHIPREEKTKVRIKPGQLFGRHCAILGATGGGKSWTVARIVQEIARINGKAILIDPTGEFHTLKDHVKHLYLGGEAKDQSGTEIHCAFPYWNLSELDLFAIFQPSGAAQAPKLREALTSLKLSAILNPDNPEVVVKRHKPRRDHMRLLAENREALEEAGARYPIRLLAKQIAEECVQEATGPSWGNYSEQLRGYCETLISKIFLITRAKPLSCIFQPEKYRDLTDEIDNFLNSDMNILRISMEHVPFEHHARELIVNCIGRYLLSIARLGRFAEAPTLVLLDEAHQFLNRNFGEESNRISLDAFGVIAKEGRKYGLTCGVATQRPRDIPEDVLSQMGMFIVHRLINQRDREVVEKACGNLDGSAAAFLPTLGQGEAILVGTDFPMPTPVKILPPAAPPRSDGPDYAKYWKPKSDKLKAANRV